MRLLSYNILDGGADRAELLLQVIADQQPDIVGLVEAKAAEIEAARPPETVPAVAAAE